MTREKIVDKIRKLRALSEKAGTEHEAASAAAMATRMMLEHRIAEVELEDEDDGEAQPIEETHVDERGVGGYKTKLPRWRGDLFNGIALALSCRSIYWGRTISVIGPRDSAQTVVYLYKYLWREIWRLSNEAVARGENGAVGSRKWKNAFRNGAAHVVVRRLRDERKAVEQETVDRGCTALVLRSDAERSQAWMEEKHDGLRKMGRVSISSGSGYSAGAAAGRRVNLSGGKGLREPAKQIRRRR